MFHLKMYTILGLELYVYTLYRILHETLKTKTKKQKTKKTTAKTKT